MRWWRRPGDRRSCSVPHSMFATHLKDFCSDTGMVISDEAMLAGDIFTQMSERWHSTSWLDHCLSTSDGHNLITAMQPSQAGMTMCMIRTRLLGTAL